MGFWYVLLLLGFPLSLTATAGTLSPVFVAHAAHCGAALLLQHPDLERISGDQAMELIGPGFVGTFEEPRIRTWFTDPVWRPWEYEVYAIRDRQKALEWASTWIQNTDVVAHLLEGTIQPAEANPLSNAYSRVPASLPSEARTVRDLLSDEGSPDGKVVGTASQLPLDYTISFKALPTKMRDSFVFLVPAARHRDTARYALVIVSTLPPR